MKTKMIVALFVLVLVSLVGANTVNATIVAEFVADGATPPNSQGWLQFAPVTGSHIAASGGDPIAWQHQDTGSGGYRVNNSTADYVSVMEGADGWTLTVESKLLACARNCAVAKVQDGGGAAYSKFELNFWDGGDFGDGNAGAFYTAAGQGVGSGTRLGAAFGTSGDIDPTDGFHKYQISMDAKGTAFATDSTDDEISIFVDDVLVAGPLARTAFPDGGEYETLIGRTGGASEGTSITQYANFKLESGSIVIPEPSALVLLTLGLLGLLGYRRRR